MSVADPWVLLPGIAGADLLDGRIRKQISRRLSLTSRPLYGFRLRRVRC
jgi:hypothetical protein